MGLRRCFRNGSVKHRDLAPDEGQPLARFPCTADLDSRELTGYHSRIYATNANA